MTGRRRRLLAAAYLLVAGLASCTGQAPVQTAVIRPRGQAAVLAPAPRIPVPRAPAPPAPVPGQAMPEPATAPPDLLSGANGAGLIEHGPRDRQLVALTFDADMTRGMLAKLQSGKQAAYYDSSIVDQLIATDTPATMFVAGLWARRYPDVVKAMAANPLFEIENHSADHAFWGVQCARRPLVTSTAAKSLEVTAAEQTIQSLTGRRPAYFRFPGGCHTNSDVTLVRRLGEEPVQWDVVSGDAFQPDVKRVVRNVVGRVRNGSIVVMHLVGKPNAPATSDALRIIIPALKARGFEFVTVSDLLQSPPPGAPALPQIPTRI